MTLFGKINNIVHKAVEARILFASIAVIVLILLLALTVNSAREKDMVEFFSRQQLANVQNTATRMADVFSQVEKNVALFSRFDPYLQIPPEEIDNYYKILSSGWESTLDTIIFFDAAGKIRNIYPRNVSPKVNLTDHFKIIRKEQKQYLGLAVPEQLHAPDLKQKTDRYLVVGCPLRSTDGKFAGAWLVSFSISAVMDKYEKQARGNAWGDLCLIDENQQIILHRNPEFIGYNIKDMLISVRGAKIDFSSDDGDFFETVVRQSGKKQQRSIVAYYPLRAGDKKWILCVVTPYSQVVSPVRKTFVYTLFISLMLILVVIIASMSFAYREGKRLRIKEGKRRLREREDWQEKLLREKKTIDGIIEGSPIPSFVINNEHKVILWNRACTEMTGYSSEEMLGTDNHYKPFYSVKRPLIADLIIDKNIEDLDKYYGNKEIKKSEKLLGAYEATDHFEIGGRGCVLYFLAAPIYDERGEIIAAIETLQDISREREMTRSLSEYAETMQNELIENIELRRQIEGLYNYLQSIVNSLPDKIYEIDENGIINFMSRGLKKKGESSSREFKDKHFMEFVASGYEEFVFAKWEDAKKGIYRPYEIEAKSKDGRKHNLL
ncbi:MAG: PAS domain S-box protein, partial [Deltaproteobacteria bacterium]|nr:PAS domain S-box protein [Deltaproteobacteria bacterium]